MSAKRPSALSRAVMLPGACVQSGLAEGSHSHTSRVVCALLCSLEHAFVYLWFSVNVMLRFAEQN